MSFRRKQNRTLWVLLGVVLLSTRVASGLDPRKAITQYHQEVWTEREGLPQGTVQSIVQTRDGYLWVGTRDGLARFDGASFTVFTAQTTPGLTCDDIRALCEDRSGTLWVGTFNGGVSVYSKGRFAPYAQQRLPSSGVIEICEDCAGNLWLGTWNGLARLADGKLTVFGTTNGITGRAVWALTEGSPGQLWVGTSRALNFRADATSGSFSVCEGFRDKFLRDLVVDRGGALWVGTMGGGLVRLQDGESFRYTAADGLADDRVTCLLQDRDGNLWVGTWGGLSRLRGGEISSYRQRDGLPHDCVETLHEDRDGNLWIGMRGGGLARLRDSTFAVFTAKEGLGSDLAKCVLEARDGALWVGTEGGGVSRLRGDRVTTFTRKDGLPSDFISALAEDPDGGIWLGTAHPAALVRCKGDSFSKLGRADGFPVQHRVRAIWVDGPGSLWCGGDEGGLCSYRGGKFTSYRAQDGLADELIRAIHRDGGGNLWVATGNGLCRFANGRFEVYTARNGLPSHAVYAIHEDGEGILFFGTQSGLARYQNGTFTAYTVREGLGHNMVCQILEDGDQNLWLGSNRGIFSLSKRAFAAFDQKRIGRLRCGAYGVADGMRTSQCEGGSQPAGWKGRDGRLWFSTAGGVAMLDPRKIRRAEAAPPVFLEQITAGDQLLSLGTPARVSSATRHISFRYSALSLSTPEKVLFRYRLSGFDKDWVDANQRRVAVYSKVPPGEYVFQVTACNGEGPWNESGAQFAISLTPQFYQTGWFYLLCAASVLLAGWSLHLRRLRQVRARLTLVLAERNRIARDLHDTLAQGFAGIGFQLETVALKLRQAPEQAQVHLELALDMVRHGLAEARRSVMNLRSARLENRDLAQALCETAREMLDGTAVRLDFQTKGSSQPLPAQLENDLLHIGQEAITNVLKHSGASQLSLELSYRPRRVLLRVEDDGRGFDPSAPSESRGARFGLLGMRERAQKLGARLEVTSHPGTGTQILLDAPITGAVPAEVA